MRRVVVFGASGDVGRYFIDYLLTQKAEYQIIAVGHRKSFSIFKDCPSVQYYPIDITQKSEFNHLPKDIFAVVDFAGLMPARMKGYYPQRYIDVNITLWTLNILDYARDAHADRFLFMQSFGDIKDYGEKEVLLTVNMPRKFQFDTDHTVYVMTKNFAVDLLENYHQLYGIKNFVFRLPTIYLYSKQDKFYVDGKERQIGYRRLIDMAKNGDVMQVWGDPYRVKDMVYVKDFRQMLLKALCVNRSHGYYNVGTGVGTTLIDQIKGIVQVLGHDNKIELRPDMPNAPQYDYISMLQDFKREMNANRLYQDEG